MLSVLPKQCLFNESYFQKRWIDRKIETQVFRDQSTTTEIINITTSKSKRRLGHSGYYFNGGKQLVKKKGKQNHRMANYVR